MVQANLLKEAVMSQILSLGRMARQLGVTQQWLREQADHGNLPCLRAGNRYLFNPLAVTEAIAAIASKTIQKGGQQ